VSDREGGGRRAGGKAPGSYRRTFLWGFWVTAIVLVITLVDSILRRSWPGLATPAMLGLALLGLERSHHHQRELANLPEADGEASWQRREQARRTNERAEVGWGLLSLGAWVGAFVAPSWFG
jgi:hypothetical protein